MARLVLGIRRFVQVTIVVLILGLLVGCGTSDAEKRAAAQEKAAARKEAAKEAKLERDRADRAACEQLVKPTRDALRQVSARLEGVGLNKSDYATKVGDVMVPYQAMTDELGSDSDPRCLDVALPLERALNAYMSADTVWSDCIEDINCDWEKGPEQKDVQKKWVNATRKLELSDTRLEAIGPE